MFGAIIIFVIKCIISFHIDNINNHDNNNLIATINDGFGDIKDITYKFTKPYEKLTSKIINMIGKAYYNNIYNYGTCNIYDNYDNYGTCNIYDNYDNYDTCDIYDNYDNYDNYDTCNIYDNVNFKTENNIIETFNKKFKKVFKKLSPKIHEKLNIIKHNINANTQYVFVNEFINIIENIIPI
jgi:hypothetical protein